MNGVRDAANAARQQDARRLELLHAMRNAAPLASVPPAHDQRPPAERVRDPRERPPPPRLVPPRHGTRDASTALVVARWMLAADDKFRFRGMRVRFLGAGWHG